MKNEDRKLITPAGDGPEGALADARPAVRASAENPLSPSGRRAFIPRAVAEAGGADLLPDSPVTEPMDMSRPSLKLPLAILAAALLLWIGGSAAVLAGWLPWQIGPQTAAAMIIILVPALLVAVLAMQLIIIRRSAAGSVRQAQQAGLALIETQNDIEDGYERLRHTTDSTAELARHASQAMALAAESMSGHQGRIAEELDRTLVQIDALSEKLDHVTRAAPRVEDRLVKLTQVLGRSADELIDRGSAIEQQFRTAATASEDARRKLMEANRSLSTQLATLQEGARGAGDELAGMSELASARIDLTLDRMRTVLDATDERIEGQTQALVKLADEYTLRTGKLGDETLARVREEADAVGRQIDQVTTRLAANQQQVQAWFADMSGQVAALSTALGELESGTADHGERVHGAVERLTADAQKMMVVLSGSGQDADALIRKAETLLLALDSGLRELDESLPAAFDRADGRLGGLREAIKATVPAVESLEAVVSGVASRVAETERLALAQAQTLEADFGGARAAIEQQEQSLARLVAAMAAARQELEALCAGPDDAAMQAFSRIGEAAQAAADKARSVIGAVIPETVAQLGKASEEAISRSVAGALVSQLDQLGLVADNAVKAAHRATDKLNRQMLSLSDSSAQLEQRVRQAGEAIEQQDRDQLSARSSVLISALNSRAIDVSKWLDRDISQTEWNAYLKGDQSLFARRAARLVSSADARQVQAIYEQDSDFAEHVSRYLHDFEALLRAILGAKDGSTLAVTMLASDIGKLYVALAQATERLRN